MIRRSWTVIVLSILPVLGMGCSGERVPRQVIVSPGTTILDADDDVLPGEVSSGLDVAIDLDGRIVARCTRRMAQA